MPIQHPLWLDYLTAIGPVIGVVAVLLVGFIQAFLQQQQANQQLFDKRFSVYTGVEAYVTECLKADGRTHMRLYQQFRLVTDPGEFLFGPEVMTYIKEIGEIGLDYSIAQDEYTYNDNIATTRSIVDLEDQRRYDDAVAKLPVIRQRISTDRMKFLAAFQGEMKAVFRPYIQLHTNLPWYARLERYMDGLLERLNATLSRH